MTSSIHDGHDALRQIDEKTDSSMAIDIEPSLIPILNRNDADEGNSKSSRLVQDSYSRKRCASRDSLVNHSSRTEMNLFTTKRQRNPDDGHATFFAVPPLNESRRSSRLDIPSRNNYFLRRSPSIDETSEHPLDWLKDFMHQSMNNIRESVVQACLTVLRHSHSPSLHYDHHPRSTADINVNQHPYHLTPFQSSNHSFGSHSSEQNRQRFVISPQTRFEDHHIQYQEQPRGKLRIHHRARSQTYPMFPRVRRVPVSDHRVPWSLDWPEYQPTNFTADEIYANPGADPDLSKCSSSLINLHFNSIDGAIDRRSVYRPYQIRSSDGVPLNPIGRTGLQGRGILLRWGPNVYHYILLCRWKRDLQGNVLAHPSNGKRILQILLEIQKEGDRMDDLILTGGLKMVGHQFPPQLQNRLRQFLIHTGKLFNDSRQISSSLLALDQLFDRTPTAWKGAYFDDARNTDNAWIELCIEYLLDSDDQYLCCIPNLNYEQLIHLDQPRFIWKDVRENIQIGPRTHYRLIESLAHKLNAFF